MRERELGVNHPEMHCTLELFFLFARKVRSRNGDERAPRPVLTPLRAQRSFTGGLFLVGFGHYQLKSLQARSQQLGLLRTHLRQQDLYSCKLALIVSSLVPRIEVIQL